MSEPAVIFPSARDLGISAAHRRDIMRESLFGLCRSMLASYARDLSELPADGVTRAPDGRPLIVPADPSDVGYLRESYARSMARQHARMAEYLTRRAHGESVARIRADWYGV